jgi:hypothetical protein
MCNCIGVAIDGAAEAIATVAVSAVAGIHCLFERQQRQCRLPIKGLQVGMISTLASLRSEFCHHLFLRVRTIQAYS